MQINIFDRIINCNKIVEMGEDGNVYVDNLQFDPKIHIAAFTSTQISDHRIFLQTICWHKKLNECVPVYHCPIFKIYLCKRQRWGQLLWKVIN